MDANDLLPSGWQRKIDQQTLEWLIRLNEDERRRLIEVSHLSEKQLGRFERLLSLEEGRWEAIFRASTMVDFLTGMLGRFPRLVLGLAALLVAFDQIWNRFLPWLTGGPK